MYDLDEVTPRQEVRATHAHAVPGKHSRAGTLPSGHEDGHAPAQRGAQSQPRVGPAAGDASPRPSLQQLFGRPGGTAAANNGGTASAAPGNAAQGHATEPALHGAPGEHQTRRFHFWTRGAAIEHNRTHPTGPRAHTGGVRDVETITARAQPGDTGVHDGQSYTVFADEVRVGGADVWRNNSAGIMGNRWGGQLRLGAIGIANRRGLAIFASPEAGEHAVAQINLGHLGETIHHRIADPATGYAPPGENDSEAYVADLVAALNRMRAEDQARRRSQPQPDDASNPLPPPFTGETTLRQLFPRPVQHAGPYDPQSPYFRRFVRAIMGIEGMLSRRNQGTIYRRDDQPPPPDWVQRLLGMQTAAQESAAQEPAAQAPAVQAPAAQHDP